MENVINHPQLCGLTENTVKWVVGGTTLFIVLVLTVPFLQDLFQFEPVNVGKIAITFVVGISTMIWFEVYKWWHN